MKERNRVERQIKMYLRSRKKEKQQKKENTIKAESKVRKYGKCNKNYSKQRNCKRQIKMAKIVGLVIKEEGVRRYTENKDNRIQFQFDLNRPLKSISC